jgi:hypothetical protein
MIYPSKAQTTRAMLLLSLNLSKDLPKCSSCYSRGEKNSDHTSHVMIAQSINLSPSSSCRGQELSPPQTAGGHKLSRLRSVVPFGSFSVWTHATKNRATILHVQTLEAVYPDCMSGKHARQAATLVHDSWLAAIAMGGKMNASHRLVYLGVRRSHCTQGRSLKLKAEHRHQQSIN